ncbi:MAG: DUF559 domain-containing protein [Candidatus Kerfeldbacteria bacterium]|nr:DUF559 domain-containing protein [Candidatus Kerfeldbacteria bacterium]
MSYFYNPKSTKELRQQLRRIPSKAEKALWGVLRNRRFFGRKFRRQHGIGPYIVDFFCPKELLILEVDGDTHFSPEQRQYDDARTSFLAKLGLRVIRFRNDEVLEDLEGVLKRLEVILLGTTTPSPSSPEEGSYRDAIV